MSFKTASSDSLDAPSDAQRTHDDRPQRPASSTPSMPSAPSTPERIGPYEIRRLLGSGGMGEVFLARDPRLDRPVAIKRLLNLDGTVMTSRQDLRFRREARLLAQLNHPAVVQIYDIVEDAGGDSLVMEYVQGSDLRRILNGKPIPWQRAARLGEEIARGLAAAHHQGIIHRDLKAENVLVTRDGRAKISDFGIAKFAPGAMEEATQVTRQGSLVGTVRSMSPEQARGEAIDHRSDLFSLGTLLFEMLTGTSPFEEGSPFKTLYNILHEDPPSLAERFDGELPAPLVELVEALLTKDRAKRPAMVLDVAETLAALAGETTLDKSLSISPNLHPLSSEAITRPISSTPGTGERRALGERREVALVACEPLLRGAMAEDPEALLEVLPALRALAAEVATQLEGVVASVVGRSVLVCLGYPVAHEDDARRAVRTAFELARRAPRRIGAELRLGVSCGTALVAAGTSPEPLILGSTADQALGLESLAAAGEVVVSEAARQRLAGAFALEELSSAYVSGMGGKIQAYRVLGEATLVVQDVPTPLVSRRAELDLLISRFESAHLGRGSAVLLIGDAGLGKSRLVRALRDIAQTRHGLDLPWWSLHGSADTRDVPFRPVVEHLIQTFDIDPKAPRQALDRLTEIAEQHDQAADHAVPLLARLLEVPYAEVYKTLELSPPKTRSETLETLVSLFLEAASHSPVVLEVEDLHWIDPSTLELLGLLLERIAMVPLFLLLTARPELEVSWSSHAALERITLAPLDPQASAELIDHLVEERRKTLGDRDHDAERPQPLLDELLRQRIIERSDGVPLFLEEVTKALLETELSDAGLIRATSDSSTTIPAIPLTLQGSLAARLDRLGTAKEVAQLAAVVGREVPWDQLLAISPIPEDELERDLERLVRAEILWRRDARERRRYIFRHSLLRDAAYSSLLQRERRDLHRRLAGYLAEGVSETGAVPLELLAHHCAAGGDHENAVLYWFQAAERAIARSANQEGITHLRRGLEILHDLPRGVERDQLELRFLSRLGAALAITRGYSAPQVEEVYGRAEALCRDLGETLQLFWVVWGLWSFHLVRARIGLAGRLAEQLVRIAEKEGDVQHILVALSCLGHVHYFSGDLAAARGALERALELDAAQREHPLTSPSGQDIGVTVRSLLALVLWHFGEDTAAVRQNDAALALARRLAHPLSVAFALIYGARLHQTRRDVRRTRKMAREAVDLSRDKGFFWVAQGIFFQGCARVETSRELSSPGREATLTGAIGLVRRGLDAYSAAGACLSRTYMLAQLAESELLSGHFAEAREILAEADELLARGDEHFWAAEIRRLAGEIAWAEGSRSDAETAYREALEIALRRGDAALASRARESLEAAEDAE